MGLCRRTLPATHTNTQNFRTCHVPYNLLYRSNFFSSGKENSAHKTSENSDSSTFLHAKALVRAPLTPTTAAAAAPDSPPPPALLLHTHAQHTPPPFAAHRLRHHTHHTHHTHTPAHAAAASPAPQQPFIGAVWLFGLFGCSAPLSPMVRHPQQPFPPYSSIRPMLRFCASALLRFCASALLRFAMCASALLRFPTARMPYKPAALQETAEQQRTATNGNDQQRTART